jgi:hypothetical protein
MVVIDAQAKLCNVNLMSFADMKLSHNFVSLTNHITKCIVNKYLIKKMVMWKILYDAGNFNTQPKLYYLTFCSSMDYT